MELENRLEMLNNLNQAQLKLHCFRSHGLSLGRRVKTLQVNRAVELLQSLLIGTLKIADP
jgi:hypothetical protein